MWLKQVQILQLQDLGNISVFNLNKKLESLAFKPCLPSMDWSIGWVSPLDSYDDENRPLTRSINGYIMLCLQMEEKILPASVIRDELNKKVRKMELENHKKVRHSEKLLLKDEIKVTLLPRAFSRFTKIYAYIDIKNQKMILGTTHVKKAEKFISLFKKSVNTDVSPIKIKNLSPIITQWLKDQNYPTSFSIEKSCLLQDPNQQSRMIRCQQQDLFTISVQSLIKDGCEVKQLAINWKDQISFVLSDDFSLKKLKFQDELVKQIKEMELETKDQQFDADFMIMTDTLYQVLDDLLSVFKKDSIESQDGMTKETDKMVLQEA